jgi:type II secretory pathway component PulF
MFDSRITTRQLAELCRRVSVSLKAGVDARTNWQREAANARGAARRPMEQISSAVSRGQTLTDAIEPTGKYFPLLFHEMVQVGEQTGHLAEVLGRLSDNYQHQLEMKKAFRQSISGPMFQLGFALFVVGVLIWVVGFIAEVRGGGAKPIDLLGLGLVGNEGLKIYLTFLACVAAVIAFIYRQVQRGAFWIDAVQLVVMRLPKIGRALELLAISRFAWSLQLTLETGMALRRALQLSFTATHNKYYTQHIDAVLRQIREGREVTEALRSTGVFPRDFLEAVQVGEQTGQLSETLATLSDHYQEEGREAVRMLTRIAGGLIWLMVTGLIVLLIFRLFMFYVGVLNDAIKGAAPGM